MSQPRLPLEIQEHILDHLHDDPKTLLACSITCSAWVPTTRLHLFYEIWLKGMKNCLSFLKTLDSTSESGEGVGGLVRKLHLSSSSFRQTSQRRGLRYDLVRKIMCQLPNVEALYLDKFNAAGFLDDTNLTVPSAISAAFDFPRLKVLDMQSLYFNDCVELLVLIAAFPRLTNLQFKEISYGTSEQVSMDLIVELVGRIDVGCRLRNLGVGEDVSTSEYLAHLIEGSSTFGSQLRTMFWSCHSPLSGNRRIFARTLARVAGTLRSLVLDMRLLDGKPSHPLACCALVSLDDDGKHRVDRER